MQIKLEEYSFWELILFFKGMVKQQLHSSIHKSFPRTVLNKSIFLGLLLFFMLSYLHESHGQTKQDTNTKTKAIGLMLKTAEEYLQQGVPEKSMLYAQNALEESNQINNNAYKAASLGLIGKSQRALHNNHAALKYFLWAIRTFEINNEQDEIADYYREIGLLYLEEDAYKKAKEYFLLYDKAKEKIGSAIPNQVEFLRNLSFIHLQLGEYEEAIKYNKILLEIYSNQHDTARLIDVYEQLSVITKNQEQYDQALAFSAELLKIYQQQNDIVNISNTYNNLGYLHKKTGNLKSSIEHFNNAIRLGESQPESLTEESQITLLTNIGIAYTNLSVFLRAKEYFIQALKIREAQENWVGKAHIHNHLASNYLISGKISLALKEVMTAIELGLTYNAKNVLATGYKILSLVYKADNNPNKARLFAEKHVEISEQLKRSKNVETKDFLQKQIAIEKKEDEIKALLAEQEQNVIEKERKESELRLKEKELAILRQDQKLKVIALQNQRLEKDKAEQALALAYQELQVEKRNRELKELEKSKQLQDLMLNQQKLEKEKQEKAIALLETDRKLKDQKINDEIARRKYAYGIIGLFILILGVASFSFRQKQKDNLKLKKHQVVIQEQNSQLISGEKELKRNVIALQNTQEILGKQKKALEIEYKKTQESIEYAKKIQASILPGEEQYKQIIPDSFVIYKPKDIVSGDFYWISKNEDKIIVAVVDCTGHGVPGALVSLIGNNALNEAINENSVTNPADILQYIDMKVTQQLNKGGRELNDGMDLGICLIEPLDQDHVKLTFSGAKNTLFVVANGNLLTLKGDRKSVGGMKKDFQFSNQEIVLKKGDVIYLTTDGYIDQAGPKRERFGSKKFKALIEDIYYIKVSDQKSIFEQALEDHQLDAEQRDDINVIGLRI